MNSQDIKEYIIINDKIEDILSELNMHNIKSHDNQRYYTAGFPDGDNRKAMTIFTDNLNVESYTRKIIDSYGNSDIFALICFVKDIYFTEALRWTCEIIGLDYYSEKLEDIPLSLQYTNLLMEINENIEEEDVILKPINENILRTYFPYGNELFFNDGISYKTQREFEIGLDLDSQRITIPIRDELGSLVGVKGRVFKRNDVDNGDKYIYLERCSKTKILYGLYKTMEYIKRSKTCIVVESEKSVLKLWENGIRNVVSIGGHNLSKTQVDKIIRLGVSEVVLCYDEDVFRNEMGIVEKKLYVDEANKFIEYIKVTAMVDIKGVILNKKESPVDDMDKYNVMFDERKVLQVA